jgi:hypothetical protein
VASSLDLHDVYIARSHAEPQIRPDHVWSPSPPTTDTLSGNFSIKLLYRDLETSGYAFWDSTPAAGIDIPGGRALKFSTSLPRGDLSTGTRKAREWVSYLGLSGDMVSDDAHVLLFKNQWTSDADFTAVFWQVRTALLDVAVLTGVSPDSSRLDAQGVHFTEYPLEQSYISHWDSQNGETTVNVVFRQSDDGKDMYVVLLC